MNSKIKPELSLYIGCMFSGKSSEMIRIIKRYRTISDINILIINHNSDNRYGKNVISSHDKEQLECLSLSNLNSIKDSKEYLEADIIFVEEAQFFRDLYDFTVYSLDKMNKRMYIFGLDGDYLKNPFGEICKLIPHAENIFRLNALCKKCNDGTKASFTLRTVKDKSVELIGNYNYYTPVCRFHYLNN